MNKVCPCLLWLNESSDSGKGEGGKGKEMRKRKKKRQRRQRIITVVLCLIMVAVIVQIAFLGKRIRNGESTRIQAFQENGTEADSISDSVVGDSQETEPTATSTPELTETPTPEPTPEVQSVSSEYLHSAHAILIRAEDGAVMMDKAASEQAYPASITKVMTAILAIENLTDLDEQLTVPEDMFPELTEQGASVAGFDPYEQVSVRSLLYGVLLPSGADACITLADQIAGSEEGFVQMMNDKAAELGMANTHFVNCTGLHDSQHYTTCEDLAILMRYCLENDTFRTIITSRSYTTEATSAHPSGITMYDSMFTKFDNSGISTTMSNGLTVEGGKTGFTDEAGQCLASFGSLNGSEYILVTMGAPAQLASEIMSVQDAETVYSRIQG